MDPASLRSEFPALERLAYLNAGTDGPVPAAAVRAAREALEDELMGGRWTPHFQARMASQAALREGYARLLGCTPDDVAITTSTSEGMGLVLAGLDLGPGDEIITSDQEHPGLLGPLRAARDRGATIRMVAFRDVADAIGPRTRLVACSHVSWVGGEVAPAALADAGIPVVLDGAQGAGAVPVDVVALGCAAYAAAGQKWLCGADATGMLYVAPEYQQRIRPVAPAYLAFADTSQGVDSTLHTDARRYDTASVSREGVAFTLAAIEMLESYGVDAVQDQATRLAETFAQALAARGRTVAPRDDTTLVAWEDPDPEPSRDRIAAQGIVIRNLPGTPYLRASVGAWNDESDLERLLAAL
jgi:selenocysteine lyase/cysteine desulfurase